MKEQFVSWNDMNAGERETFLVCQGLHSMYISRLIGKRFENLPITLQKRIRHYKIKKTI